MNPVKLSEPHLFSKVFLLVNLLIFISLIAALNFLSFIIRTKSFIINDRARFLVQSTYEIKKWCHYFPKHMRTRLTRTVMRPI